MELKKIIVFFFIIFCILLISKFNFLEKFQSPTTTPAPTTPAPTTPVPTTPAPTTPAPTITVSSNLSLQNQLKQLRFLDSARTQQARQGSQTLQSQNLITNSSLLDTNVDESISEGNSFENYFQGGFCKYQEKLGYYVGCSDHIYDNAHFNLDRELDSVKPEYTILSR